MSAVSTPAHHTAETRSHLAATRAASEKRRKLERKERLPSFRFGQDSPRPEATFGPPAAIAGDDQENADSTGRSASRSRSRPGMQSAAALDTSMSSVARGGSNSAPHSRHPSPTPGDPNLPGTRLSGLSKSVSKLISTPANKIMRTTAGFLSASKELFTGGSSRRGSHSRSTHDRPPTTPASNAKQLPLTPSSVNRGVPSYARGTASSAKKRATRSPSPHFKKSSSAVKQALLQRTPAPSRRTSVKSAGAATPTPVMSQSRVGGTPSSAKKAEPREAATPSRTSGKKSGGGFRISGVTVSESTDSERTMSGSEVDALEGGEHLAAPYGVPSEDVLNLSEAASTIMPVTDDDQAADDDAPAAVDDESHVAVDVAVTDTTSIVIPVVTSQTQSSPSTQEEAVQTSPIEPPPPAQPQPPAASPLTEQREEETKLLAHTLPVEENELPMWKELFSLAPVDNEKAEDETLAVVEEAVVEADVQQPFKPEEEQQRRDIDDEEEAFELQPEEEPTNVVDDDAAPSFNHSSEVEEEGEVEAPVAAVAAVAEEQTQEEEHTTATSAVVPTFDFDINGMSTDLAALMGASSHFSQSDRDSVADEEKETEAEADNNYDNFTDDIDNDCGECDLPSPIHAEEDVLPPAATDVLTTASDTQESQPVFKECYSRQLPVATTTTMAVPAADVSLPLRTPSPGKYQRQSGRHTSPSKSNLVLTPAKGVLAQSPVPTTMFGDEGEDDLSNAEMNIPETTVPVLAAPSPVIRKSGGTRKTARDHVTVMTTTSSTSSTCSAPSPVSALKKRKGSLRVVDTSLDDTSITDPASPLREPKRPTRTSGPLDDVVPQPQSLGTRPPVAVEAEEEMDLYESCYDRAAKRPRREFPWELWEKMLKESTKKPAKRPSKRKSTRVSGVPPEATATAAPVPARKSVKATPVAPVQPAKQRESTGKKKVTADPPSKSKRATTGSITTPSGKTPVTKTAKKKTASSAKKATPPQRRSKSGRTTC